MSLYKKIKIADWKRCKMYRFYQTFDNKLFNITFSLQMRPLYNWAKQKNESFFAISLYALMRAMNEVPEFRQRHFDDAHIIEYEHISVMTPIMKADELFTQILMAYTEDFETFKINLKKQIEAVHAGCEECVSSSRNDLFIASCTPWFTFDSITQAGCSFNQDKAILAWGRMDENGKIPISVSLNHSFIDGLHVSRFVKALETFVEKWVDL